MADKADKSAADAATVESNNTNASGDIKNPEEGDGMMMQKKNYEPLKSLSDLRTTQDLTEDGVRHILRRYTKDFSLEIVSMGSLEDMSGLNDAFNSCICSLSVSAKLGSGESQDFHFVVKSPPQSTFIRQMHKFTRPFFNEVAWYEELVPALEKVHGQGCIERLVPRCYFAYSNYYMQEGANEVGCCEKKKCPWFCFVPCKPSEVGILVLENIKHRADSYKMFDKIKPMDLAHVHLVMKELANFHGMWLRYKYASLQGRLEPEALAWDTFLRRHNTQKRMPKMIYTQLKKVAKRTVLRTLSQQPEDQPEDYAAKCRRFFDVSATRWLDEYMREGPKASDTLCHGDFWSNNILFTYNDASEPDKPSSLVIIDYQLLNVGSPCYDLVYFVYLNTDLSFRDAHLADCLKLYHDQLATYFNDDLIWSFEDFMKDFHRFKAIGFTTACSVMPNILSDNKVDIQGNPITAFQELQRKQEEDMDDVNSVCGQEIKRRITDLVKEMARDGVI